MGTWTAAKGDPNWGPDRLGEEVLEGGQDKIFDMRDDKRNCCRDMKATFSN